MLGLELWAAKLCQFFVADSDAGVGGFVEVSDTAIFVLPHLLPGKF